MQREAAARATIPVSVLAPLAAAAGLLAWAYLPTLREMAHRWGSDPQYSHGYLVPAFSVFLLWWRAGRLQNGPVTPSLWAVPVLLLGLGMRLAGGRFGYDWLDGISLLPTLAGVFLSVGGRTAWRWAWPSIAFLAFMVPLPYRVEIFLTGPMQRVATVCSTFVMQTVGVPAVAVPKSNVILLPNQPPLEVVEACSGLRMLVIFFALSTAFVLVVDRPWWEKGIILGSAVPIALVSNVARIAITGVLFQTVGSQQGRDFFHEKAGWFMMVLGLALLWLELWLLGRLLIRDERPRPVALGLGRAPARRPPPSAGWGARGVPPVAARGERRRD